MKRSGFKYKSRVPLKRTPLLRKTALARIGKLAKKSREPSAVLKDEIQAILRKIVIARDGGCFLRNYKKEITPQYQKCGGYRKSDGKIILQAEHLHTRSRAVSFSDPRLVVCICQRHHIYYKPQHPDEYYRLAKKYIGEERTKLLERVQADKGTHKVDLKLELLALKQIYEKEYGGTNDLA